jgi:hypothetical protein
LDQSPEGQVTITPPPLVMSASESAPAFAVSAELNDNNVKLPNPHAIPKATVLINFFISFFIKI